MHFRAVCLNEFLTQISQSTTEHKIKTKLFYYREMYVLFNKEFIFTFINLKVEKKMDELEKNHRIKI